MRNEAPAWSDIETVQPELERLQKALLEVLPVFPAFFDRTECRWPYTLRVAAAYEPFKEYSFSTNAMIACVIGHVLGFTGGRMLTVPSVKPLEVLSLPEADREGLRGVWRATLEKFVESLPAKKVKFADLTPWPPGEWPEENALFTYSGTFGLNDPFTLSWIADLYLQSHSQNVVDAGLQKKLRDLRPIFLERTHKVCRFIAAKFPGQPLCTKTEGASLDHAFPWMRWARLLTFYHDDLREQLNDGGLTDAVKADITAKLQETEEWRPRLLSHLEAILHRHLSYAGISDSEYDPPEMVLALEGVLVLKRDYDPTVVKRVFATLAQPDMSRLFWRAHRPMIAQPQGMVLPPISTEIGNSVLRICGMVEPNHGGGLFALCQAPLRRYSEWLLSRRVSGRAKRSDGQMAEFSGWHSDHVLAGHIVHLWMTAHTLLFLHDYTAFLGRHVRRLTRFSIASTEECRAEARSKDKDCEKELAGREPLGNIAPNSIYRVTDRLADEFIKPWKEGAPKNFSMLLYGPPGTGKTSFAKLFAGSLGWDLIQLSPSDFVRGGEAEVEEHAKAVFHALEQISTSVVLFDEIDRLLLDRDAKAYNTQGDVFQFMTPGMLTKINDLAAKRRLVFIISTNFAERIDGAIKRPGRIDQQYLWLPPDAKQRRYLLAMLLARRANEDLPKWDAALKADEKRLKALTDQIQAHAVTGMSKELVGATSSWIFKELEQLFERTNRNKLSDPAHWDKDTVLALAKGDATQFKKVAAVLLENTRRVTPIIRLLNYKNRFRSTAAGEPDDFLYAAEPYEEFLLLLLDAFRSSHVFTVPEKKGLLEPFARNLTKPDLEQVHDQVIRDELASELSKFGYKA